MFIISITLNRDVTDAQQSELFPRHVEWLQRYFSDGIFLLMGPYRDTDAHAGVILAKVGSRDALQSILEEDCYYSGLATYDIREFSPTLVAENISNAVKSGDLPSL